MSFTLAVLVPVLLAACTTRTKRPERHLGPEVAAPAGSPWRSARMVADYRPKVCNRTCYPAVVRFSLELVDHAGKPHAVLLESTFEGTGPGQVSAEEMKQIRRPVFHTRFSADGRSVAVSRDGGLRWRLVALEDPSAPFWCVHQDFAPGPGGDPFVPARPADDLALLVLASPDAHQLYLPEGSNQPCWPESERALLYLCSRRTDPRLARAALNEVSRQGVIGHGPEPRATLARCVADLLRPGSAVLEPFLADHERCIVDPVATGCPGHLIEVLAQGSAPEMQRTLARAIEVFPAVAGLDRDRRLARAERVRALRMVTIALGAIPEDVREVLLKVAREPGPPIKAPPRSMDESEPEWFARIDAIRALAVAGSSEGRALLETIAKEPCDKPLPRLGPDRERWGARLDDYEPISAGCWARAALAAALVR